MKEILQSCFRYALSLSHDHHQAEDLVQEAFRKIIESKREINKALLMASIRNLFIDSYRRMRLVQFEPLGEDDQFADLDSKLDMVAHRIDIQSALKVLQPEERELIYLNIVEGWSCQEIAKFTNRPRGTILSLIHRAKKKMAAFANIENSNKEERHGIQ